MKKFSIEAVIYPHLPWPSFNRCMLPQIWINCESWSAFGTDSKDGERIFSTNENKYGIYYQLWLKMDQVFEFCHYLWSN